MSDAAVHLEGVACRAGRFRLGPLDFVAPRGAVTALVGPNGAGKTTTLDLIMGMGRPDSGAIHVLGLQQPRDEVAIKARTAYAGPDLDFAAWGAVGRAIDFVSGFYPDWDDARCERLMRELELGRAQRIQTLSFGARIKLALVMALSRNAELLVLDEPTVGLDAAARRVLYGEILAFVEREDRAVVISSHQLADLERLADRLVILDEGRIIASGRTDELLQRYVTLDATVAGHGAPLQAEGVTLLERDGARARLLLDRYLADPEALKAAGVEPVAETPMTLDELVLALTDEPKG